MDFTLSKEINYQKLTKSKDIIYLIEKRQGKM